jgi:hypothetical protein
LAYEGRIAVKINKTVSIIFTLLTLSLIGFGSVEYATGETISGYVYANDGSTGIDKVQVSAFGAGGLGCGDWQKGILTNSNGYYSLVVPAGKYYVFADASLNGCQPYIDEWWRSGSGTLKCAEAEGIGASDSNVPYIDF